MGSKSPLDISLLERVRRDRQLSVRDFCSRLSLPMEDYVSFLRADNLRNFPPRSLGLLRDLMLEMERENLNAFRQHAGSKTTGYFQSSKVLRHLDKVAGIRGPARELVGPITVELHLSNVCNHRCPGCTFNVPQHTQEKQEGDAFWKAQFDTRLMNALVSDMVDLGVRGVLLSGGGEPTLHAEAAAVIRHLHSAGLDVGLVTNGSMLYRDDDRGRELRSAIVDCCTWCRVSVDAGDQASYEEMHGRAPAVNFGNLIAGIRQLTADKHEKGSKLTLGVSYLLTPRNYLNLVTSVIEFREIEGLDYFQVKPMEVPPIERSMQLDMIFWDRRVFDTLVMLGAYEREGFSVYTPGYKFIDLFSSETDGLPFSRCWGHPFLPTIAADGTVVVCCHMLEYAPKNGVGVYGKITAERGLKMLWQSSERFAVGEEIAVRMCPSNCKLAEANKTLEAMSVPSPHANFLS